jgi:hypothetical protein
VLSSPGLTGRSSNHRPGILDCPVKPGNDTAGRRHARSPQRGRRYRDRRTVAPTGRHAIIHATGLKECIAQPQRGAQHEQNEAGDQ